jgi:hypothetical protein
LVVNQFIAHSFRPKACRAEAFGASTKAAADVGHRRSMARASDAHDDLLREMGGVGQCGRRVGVEIDT